MEYQAAPVAMVGAPPATATVGAYPAVPGAATVGAAPPGSYPGGATVLGGAPPPPPPPPQMTQQVQYDANQMNAAMMQQAMSGSGMAMPMMPPAAGGVALPMMMPGMMSAGPPPGLTPTGGNNSFKAESSRSPFLIIGILFIVIGLFVATLPIWNGPKDVGVFVDNETTTTTLAPATTQARVAEVLRRRRSYSSSSGNSGPTPWWVGIIGVLLAIAGLAAIYKGTSFMTNIANDRIEVTHASTLFWLCFKKRFSCNFSDVRGVTLLATGAANGTRKRRAFVAITVTISTAAAPSESIPIASFDDERGAGGVVKWQLFAATNFPGAQFVPPDMTKVGYGD